ncbi:hypothetical protein HPB49_001600 [Dermacentor silvarum]|uniref:Uncharacterized protein n=1 Tax=Dermacentor silvarum TaxID=543639 RepID=A0ACB8CJ80_DERSI|nr:hypothetical protein HPB49_001600 [Dermacentor silvarum]
MDSLERMGSVYETGEWPTEPRDADAPRNRDDVDPCVCCFRTTATLAGLIVALIFLTKIVDRTIDADRDPCVDFYEYACGNYRGGSVLLEMEHNVTVAVDSVLPFARVPDRHQSAVQKAVGMFRACLAAPEDERGVEMRALREFTASLDIDLVEPGERRDSSDPNPGRDALRLSLEYGLHAFIEFSVSEYNIPRGEPLLQVSLAVSDETWFAKRSVQRFNLRTLYYSAVIAHYSGRAPSEGTKELVLQLSALEDEVQSFIITEKARRSDHWTFEQINNILNKTQKEQNAYTDLNDAFLSDNFGRMVAHYSLGRYTGDDIVYANLNAIALLRLLMTSGREIEFHRLVSWSIVRQLAGFGRNTEHFGLATSVATWYLCVALVSQVMEAPLMGLHLLQAVPESYLRDTEVIFSRLKKSYEGQLKKSSWLDSISLENALAKLRAMQLANGFPHGMRDQRDMDIYFAEFPESPRGGSFWQAWLSAARIVQRREMQKSSTSDVVFSTGSAIAYFAAQLDKVFVPAGMIGRPVFYKQGPPAHNYGALGMIIAHEMSHGYDVQGVSVDASGLLRQWLTHSSRRKYESMINCIQSQHAEVRTPCHGKLQRVAS